jgi:hypothetical protein
LAILLLAQGLAAAALAQTTNTPSVSNGDTNPPAKLPEVVVTGRQEPEGTYVATNAISATKMNIPLLQTPQAVSIFYLDKPWPNGLHRPLSSSTRLLLRQRFPSLPLPGILESS